jgi:uncharacterized membrane protein YedE/YeeE
MTELAPYSPWLALAGGLMIGLSAAVMIVVNGQIAGISGILASATRLGGGAPWRLSAAFILGLPIGALLAGHLARAPTIAVTSAAPALIAGGVLVGFGTRLGNGCTSGHGVCGLARLSMRSFVATVVFMVAAGLVVFVARHVLGAGS